MGGFEVSKKLWSCLGLVLGALAEETCNEVVPGREKQVFITERVADHNNPHCVHEEFSYSHFGMGTVAAATSSGTVFLLNRVRMRL